MSDTFEQLQRKIAALEASAGVRVLATFWYAEQVPGCSCGREHMGIVPMEQLRERLAEELRQKRFRVVGCLSFDGDLHFDCETQETVCENLLEMIRQTSSGNWQGKTTRLFGKN